MKAKYLRKKMIDMVAITPKRANAQSLTCFITFITAAFISIAMMLVAAILPTMVETVTETTCWISMGLEAASLVVGYLATWIKRNTL